VNKESREHVYNPAFFRLHSNIQTTLHAKPKMDYFKASGTKESIYKDYLAERNNENFAKLSQYYFDTAESLFSMGDAKNGLRVLSTLAELDLENPQFLR
jgi:hypothetical protein